MAKVYGKKTFVGNINKRKDGSGSYFKVNNDFQLKKGMFVNLASVADQIKDLKDAEATGRLTEDVVAERIARLENDKNNYGLLFTVYHQEISEG